MSELIIIFNHLKDFFSSNHDGMGERLSISNLRGPGHSMYRDENRYFCCFFNELCHGDCLGENIVYTHAEKADNYVCTERGVRRKCQESKKKHSILVWGYQAGPENISRRFRSTEMTPSVVLKAIGG